MSFFTIQSIFLFYSAIGIFCGLLLIGLFWGRKDVSARIWIASCFLSAFATMVTVYRDQIPLQISYSMMVSIETLALLLLSQSLRSLIPEYKVSRGIARVLLATVIFCIAQEGLRFLSGGKLVPSMSLLTSFAWIFVDFFCAYAAVRVGKYFAHPLFLNLMSCLFIGSGLLFLFRSINILTSSSHSAFDPQVFNFIIYFGIAIFSSFRSLLYIILRMHLGFSENSRLNNLNLRLNNILEERDRLISSLTRLNKSAEVNALSSTIAHEVNQPLGASKLDVQFALHILKNQPDNTSALGVALSSLLGNIDRASTIIRNLSNLTRKANLVEEKVALNNLLLGVVQISRGRCAKLGIDIEFAANEDFSVLANLGELQQVFINLINNAIDELEATRREAGNITLWLSQHENFVRIHVQDNGRGVTPGKEKSIFDLLNSDKDGGSGIGLWLSQSIVVRYEGNIWYERAPAGGSVFIVQFPLSSED